MREIKFRGRRVDNGEWVYGNVIFKTSDAYSKRIDCGIQSDYCYPQEVDKETVGQYTGLKDKNGVEIYDGDILACKFHPRYVERISWKGKPDAICTVFYDFNAFRLMAKGEEDERYADFFDFLDNMEYKQQMHDLSLTHTEVIGNIHEVSNETTM